MIEVPFVPFLFLLLQLFVGELSVRGSIREGKCPSGKCQSGICLVREKTVGDVSIGELSVGEAVLVMSILGRVWPIAHVFCTSRAILKIADRTW